MTHTTKFGMALALALLLAACGGSGDGGNIPDGGGAPACSMEIISVIPMTPMVGQTVAINSQIAKTNVAGLEVYTWAVTRDGNSIPFVPDNNPNAREIQFTADIAGLYEVTLMGSVGAVTCTTATRMLMVSVTGANVETYRLRVIPALGAPAPTYQEVLPVTGGTDNYRGPISLSQGVLASGTVFAPDSSATGAYLRASSSDEIVAEGFADDTGAFQLRMPFGTYDLLVVPYTGSAPPLEVDAIDAQSLSDVSIPAGDAITGQVTDGGGSSVVGATVALTVDGVPSTLGVTGGAGDFGVLARAGASAELSIDPPEGSSQPSLVASVGSIGNGNVITAQYSASIGSRTFGFDVVASDGTTPLSDARVVFSARPIASAGTIAIDGGTPIVADGRARVAVTADAQGSVSSVSLPNAEYDVFVEAPDGAGEVDAWLVLDLTTGQASPSQLALEAPATANGKVVDDLGAPIAGAAVSAVPISGLPGGAIATSTAITAADGSYSLTLSPGVSYDIRFDPGTDSGHGRARTSATAPGAGAQVALPDQTVPAAVSVFGEVVISGLATGGAGAQLTVFCDSCSGLDALVPIAEAIADASGQFELVVPDPGVGN